MVQRQCFLGRYKPWSGIEIWVVVVWARPWGQHSFLKCESDIFLGRKVEEKLPQCKMSWRNICDCLWCYNPIGSIFTALRICLLNNKKEIHINILLPLGSLNTCLPSCSIVAIVYLLTTCYIVTLADSSFPWSVCIPPLFAACRTMVSTGFAWTCEQ